MLSECTLHSRVEATHVKKSPKRWCSNNEAANCNQHRSTIAKRLKVDTRIWVANRRLVRRCWWQHFIAHPWHHGAHALCTNGASPHRAFDFGVGLGQFLWIFYSASYANCSVWFCSTTKRHWERRKWLQGLSDYILLAWYCSRQWLPLCAAQSYTKVTGLRGTFKFKRF